MLTPTSKWTKFPLYVLNTNKSTRECNNFIFENAKGQEYLFDANDQHHDTCPKHFKFKNDWSQIARLHSKIQVKIGMLVELCVGNYAIPNGLFNGVDGVFQYVCKIHDSESLIWITFNNPKACSIIRIQNQHLYTINIPKHWTPLQPISKEI
jgi:hypothetical protein